MLWTFYKKYLPNTAALLFDDFGFLWVTPSCSENDYHEVAHNKSKKSTVTYLSDHRLKRREVSISLSNIALSITRRKRNSGLHPVNLLQRWRRLFYWPEKWCAGYLVVVVCKGTWPTSISGEEQSGHRAHYVELLGRFDAELQKNYLIWRRKLCSSTMGTHQLTSPPSPRPNWSN